MPPIQLSLNRPREIFPIYPLPTGPKGITSKLIHNMFL